MTPIQVTDNLPDPSVTNEGADLSRIKYYRNLTAHCNGSLTDVDYEKYWLDICQVLYRFYSLIINKISSSIAYSKGNSIKTYTKENSSNISKDRTSGKELSYCKRGYFGGVLISRSAILEPFARF